MEAQRNINLNAVYRKFKSIGFSGSMLKRGIASGSKTRVFIEELATLVEADPQQILNYNLTAQFNGFAKDGDNTYYHYPFTKFEFVSGDHEWLEKLYAHFGWQLKKDVNQGNSPQP